MLRRFRRSAVRTAARTPEYAGAEQLEVRRLLTTYTVSTGADVVAADGEISLREALQAAQTNSRVFDAMAGDEGRDVVTFADGLTEISIDGALPALSDSIVIDGRDTIVTIDANFAGGFLGGIFTLTGAEGGTFSLSDLRLTGGAGAGGGAMLATGGADVLLDTVSFVENTSASGGGALTIAGGSTVEMTDGAFIDQFAGPSVGGGAIQVIDGAFVGENVDFVSNVVGGDGGAVLVGEGGAFSLDGGSFVDNGASVVTDGLPSRGGAIFVTEGGSALLTDVTLSDNESTLGGAVYSEGEFGARDADFARNRALSRTGRGGAIFAASGTAYLEDVSLRFNEANQAGGAIEVGEARTILRDFTLSDNRAGEIFFGEPGTPGNGGGLHVSGAADVALVNGRIDRNFAAAEGGGVWNSAEGEMTLRDVIATDNVADGGRVGQGGGAVYNDGGTLRINDSAFARNLATGSSGSGGALLTVAGQVRVIETAFDSNVANRAGGAVEILDGRATFVNGRLVRNLAGPGGSATPGNGGAVHVGGEARTTFRGTRVSVNDAAAEGGGLWNSAAGRMTLRGVALSSNTAGGRESDQGGGGLYNDGGRVDVFDSFVGDNDADGAAGSGGGVLTVAGRLNVADTNFARNTAVRAGGAIEVVAGRVTIAESNLLANRAGEAGGDAGNGGALHVTGTTATVRFTGGAVARNDAGAEGGGLWNQSGSELTMRDLRVRDNEAALGGGVFNNGGRVVASDRTRVDQNVAEGNGGGFFNVSDGEIVIENSAVRRNDAAFGGGIFLAQFSDATLRDAVFTGNTPDDVAGRGFLFGDDDGIDRA